MPRHKKPKKAQRYSAVRFDPDDRKHDGQSEIELTDADILEELDIAEYDRMARV